MEYLSLYRVCIRGTWRVAPLVGTPRDNVREGFGNRASLFIRLCEWNLEGGFIY